MKLGPTEQARLLVFQVAELARRQRDRGLRLNAPEAIAIACDEMHMAARAGGSFDEVVDAGMRSVAADDLENGVSAMIAEIRLEVLLADGTRLIVLRGLGASDAGTGVEPGATVVADGTLTLNEGLSSIELEVTNDSDHAVRVSSHFPFDRVNPRLTLRPRRGPRVASGHPGWGYRAVGARGAQGGSTRSRAGRARTEMDA